MILSVYVVGAGREVVRCKHWIDELEKTGIQVTYDWTVPLARYGTAGLELSRGERCFFVRQDLRGIDECRLVWFLVPPLEVVTLGAWTELGYALGQKKTIVASPPVMDRWIFAAMPQVREFPSDVAAFAFIQEYQA